MTESNLGMGDHTGICPHNKKIARDPRKANSENLTMASYDQKKKIK